MTPTVRPDITPADINAWSMNLTNRQLIEHLSGLLTSKGGRLSFAQKDAMLRELLRRFDALIDAGEALRRACNDAGNPTVPTAVSLAIARVTTEALDNPRTLR